MRANDIGAGKDGKGLESDYALGQHSSITRCGTSHQRQFRMRQPAYLTLKSHQKKSDIDSLNLWR